jgi:nitric oxide reductase NorD protein
VAEPEDVLAEGALAASRIARELWTRRSAGRRSGPPRLGELRPRLELFIAAVFHDAPAITTADPPATPSFLARMARRSSAHPFGATALASTDGSRIRLPGALEGVPEFAVPERYRLLALQQAARASRRTAQCAPADVLLRDLYLLSEAASVDALLVGMLPRLGPALQEARREAARHRAPLPRGSPRELAVETLVRSLLASDPATPPEPWQATDSAEGSLRWATERHMAMLGLSGPYRGIAPVPLWGTVTAQAEAAVTSLPGESGWRGPPVRSRQLPRRPRVRDAAADEDDLEPGTWMVRADDLQEKAEDPAGLQRPADRDQHADPGELADAVSELPALRLVRTPQAVHEILVGEDPLPRAPETPAGSGTAGIAYPEWDWRRGVYQPRAATVREFLLEVGNPSWADDALRRQAAAIRAVRRDFERLRPRRMALRRQPEGAEVDLEAVVAAHADRQAGGVADERWYVDSRPLRRDTAIALLLDASASTDGWVAGDRRIIDVEKEALLIVREALATLGEPHAILAFSGEGAGRVRVGIIRRFDEPAGAETVRGRIAGLEPDGYTRAGAALRHATAGLLRQAARHRLLLVLSDGRPNDVDQYEGRYGVEDTRVAVREARLQGVHVFCLTVDREAPRYVPRIFGRDFVTLSRAELLPRVLSTVLRRLVRG